MTIDRDFYFINLTHLLMNKEYYIQKLDELIDQAKQDHNLALASIFYTVTASIQEDSLDDLSDLTVTWSLKQLQKYTQIKIQQN